MKRYKAQIFSTLMSICVATTFVGYNFTISDAYVQKNPYKYGLPKASIYLDIENISGETVDGNTDASGELKLIKGKTYTAHVKTSDIQPEVRQIINIEHPSVYIGEKSYRLTPLHIPLIGEKLHAEGDVKFTAGEGELNKENGSETVVFSLRGKRKLNLNDKYEHINTELQYDLYLETNFVDENGDKIADAQVVKYNEKATKPEGLEKEGYDLSWELNDKVYDFNESVTDNITLKAKYTPKKYEVKFQDNFGNTIAHTVEVNHNETVAEPKAKDKGYYSFKEWQLDGKKYDFSNKIVKPLTLVGEYDKPIGYYVCFIQNEQLHDSVNFIDITQNINAKSKVDKSVLDALYEVDTDNAQHLTKDISEGFDANKILGDSEEALNKKATEIFKSKKERPAWLDKEDYEVKMYRLVIERDGLHVDMKLIGKDGQEIKPPAKTYTVQFKDDEGNT
ncbi:MAG: InlB B-repeat-containing protein, partial [Peptostreptococcaceae bacterium]|nr:InlB B-repeat-containing protein [Peptostreptococcaceae bacterium]